MAKLAIAIGAGIGFGILGFFTGGAGWLGLTAVSGMLLGASVGVTVGGVIGNALFPMSLPTNAQPPLITSGATNGVPIPYGYGTYRFAGNIIWSPGLQEVSVTTSSGKGGMGYSQQNISYTASFACAFGEGPGDIVKIWFDSKVGYDITSGVNQAYYFDPENNNVATLYPVPTFYQGTQTQLPDPTIQGTVGVNATSAFRPLIYCVWEDLLLANFGNRIPNIQALVQYQNTYTQPIYLPSINFGYESSTGATINLPVWVSNTGINCGQKIVDGNGNLQIAQSTGSTHTGSPPFWSTVAGTLTVDGGVTWLLPGTPAYAITVGDTIYSEVRFGTDLTAGGGSIGGLIDSEGYSWTELSSESYFSQIFRNTTVVHTFYAVATTNVLNGGAYNVGPSSESGIVSGIDIIVAGITGVGQPIANVAGAGTTESFAPNGNFTAPISISTTASGPCFAISAFAHDYTSHSQPDGFQGLVAHGNGFETYWGLVSSAGEVTASQTVSADYVGDFAGYAVAMTLFPFVNVSQGITPGVLNVDSGSAVGQNTGSSITSGTQVPTDTGDLCFMISAGGTITPVGDSWQTYDASLAGYGNISYFIMPPTTTEAVADATLSGGGNWATAVLSFALAGNTLPAYVQKVVSTGSFASPETFAFTSPTTNNNTILVINIINSLTGNTDAFCGLTDSQENVYQQVHLHQNNVELDIWVTQNVVGAANSFIITGVNSGTDRCTVAYELPGGSFPAASLDNVISDICLRAGLDPATQIDVTQCAGIPVKGYLVTSQSDAKSALQTPLSAFFVDAVESDFVLKFVPRGANDSVMTVAESDLGLKADKCELTETIVQQQELPQEVDIVFIDPSIDWQQNKTQKTRSSRTVKTKQVVSMNLPMLLTPTDARAIAEKALYLAWLERRPFDFNLWKMAYAVLDPTDVINFVYEGATYRARIVAAGLGAGYSITMSTVSENASAYLSSPVGGASQGVPPQAGQPLVPTVTWLYDLPLLQDSDASADRSQTGFYWGMSGALPKWPGGVLYKSSDDTTFNPLASSFEQMTYGVCTTTLAAPAALWTWDTVNTLTIQPTFGTLSGTSDLAVLNGANALLVGGELIQYANAVLNMDGTYTVSRLLRGRRNTEFAVGTHTSGEWAIDPQTGLQHATATLSTLGLLRYYRGVTTGQEVTAVADQDLTLAGNDLKPASPVHIKGTRDGSNNLTIGWTRRTRYAGDWLENTGSVALNEDSEQYSIDVIKAGVPVRTITWTTGSYNANGNPTASYSAAQQATDFGSTQADVEVDVYQISGQVGRGFPGTATI